MMSASSNCRNNNLNSPQTLAYRGLREKERIEHAVFHEYD
jgi:hypothetical protein